MNLSGAKKGAKNGKISGKTLKQWGNRKLVFFFHKSFIVGKAIGKFCEKKKKKKKKKKFFSVASML